MNRILAPAALLAAFLMPPAGRADVDWTPGEVRLSADPAGQAIADNDADCPGAATVHSEFLRRTDVDGDGRKDAVLNWGGLRCDGGARSCGSGGCRQEVWLAGPEGPWRLLLAGRIDEVHVPVPGALVLRLDPEDCEPANSRVCFRAYDVWGGVLRPLRPSAEAPAP